MLHFWDDQASQAPPEQAVGSGRRLSPARRSVGADGAVAAPASASSPGVPQPTDTQSQGDGRDPVRAAHRMTVERAFRHRDPLLVLGPSPVPGVDAGRGVRGVLARGPAGLRRSDRDRLDVVISGRSHGQGDRGWGKTRPQSHRPRQAWGQALGPH